MKKITFLLSALMVSLTISAEVIRLDLSQPTNPETFEFNEAGMWSQTWSDAVDYKYFTTQAFQFSHLLGGNSWGGTYWEGFTVSKATADGAGYGYYSNMAKGGLNGFATPYILAYYNEWWLMDDANDDMMSSNHILFDDAYYPRYVYLNNAFVSYQNILEGGGVARAFHQGDKFEVWIKGLDEDFEEGDEKVVCRLADFTSENEAEWFVNTKWEKVDLSVLGKVSGLSFTVVSTDQGDYGTNTATYFALDGLTISTTADEDAPEPAVKPVVATFENVPAGINVAKADTCWQGADAPAIGWNNWTSGDYTFQSYYGGNSGYGEYYSAWTVSNETANTSTGYLEPNRSAKGGAYEGQNFASWNLNFNGIDTITFDKQVVPGFFINNNAYAVTSMCNGDGFAKKFGKDDWFKLTCIGVLNGAKTKELDVYLAKDGEYITEWTYVDLSELGEIDGLTFNMSSSDESGGYMNTPAYFCMDAFGAEKPANYEEPARTKFTIDITIESSELTLVDAIADEGWWQLMADNEEYSVYICTPEGGATQVAGTYSVEDLDPDYSCLVVNATQEDILFESGSLTVSIDEQTGNISFVGSIVCSDGFTYNINITYVIPTAQQTVEVSIADAELDDTLGDWDLYTVSGTDANDVTITLSFWTEEDAEDIVGEYTENDLESMYAETSVVVGETTTAIYSATISIVAGEGEGGYIITAELLCSNNTLYQVTMVVPGVISAIDNNTIATKPVKVVRDGQALIIRNGKTFTIQGVELK